MRTVFGACACRRILPAVYDLRLVFADAAIHEQISDPDDGVTRESVSAVAGAGCQGIEEFVGSDDLALRSATVSPGNLPLILLYERIAF